MTRKEIHVSQHRRCLEENIRSAYLTLSVLAIGLTACSDGTSSSSNTVVLRDSAGIHIVESAGPAWGDSGAWRIEAVPSLDLTTSGIGPQHEFHRVLDATRLADGTIVVADAGSRELRFYSPTGKFVRAVGRDGEGPGEFRGLTRIDQYRGDSLIAFDIQLERATVFDKNGGVARVIRLALPFVLYIQPLQNGSFVGMLAWPSVDIEEGEPGLIRYPVPVVRFSASGEVIDTLIMSPGHEEVRIAGEYGFSSARPLFARQTHVKTAGEAVYIGTADQLEYQIYANASELTQIVRVPTYDLSLSVTEIEAERTAILGNNPSPRLRKYVSELPMPESRPAYSKLIVDHESCVWTAEDHGLMVGYLGHNPKHWQVFSERGVWLGRVQSPARFTVLEIGTDYVLGVQRDELDVEHVQVLRLHRARPGR